MITATCKDDNCQANGIGYLILGEPPLVECGGCGNPTELTEPQPDPPRREATIQ